jgi:hypothetical protein
MGGPLDRFVAELWRTPIPAAPLAGDRWLELLGLSLFDLTLNQQHVSRMSERLSLIDATHLTRRVSLEIDMSARQVETAMALGLRRAFVVYLEAPQDTDEDTALVGLVRDTLHRTQWLIEAAIASVVAHGMANTGSRSRCWPRRPPTPVPSVARPRPSCGPSSGRTVLSRACWTSWLGSISWWSRFPPTSRS